MAEMPDFVRRAIEAQGKVDPDEVAELAADEEYDQTGEPPQQEIPALADPEPEPEQEEIPLDTGQQRPDWA